GLPLGLAAGGALVPALIVLPASIVLVTAFVGLTSLAISLLHLIVRDRRRGELVALAFIMILPLLGVLPHLLSQVGHRRRGAPPAPPASPSWVARAGERAFGLLPSELYISATRAAVAGDAGSPAVPLAGLVAS